MIGDLLLPVLGWWLFLTALGWAAFPIVSRLLSVLPDRGLAFSRPVGLLLAGYAFWIAVSAGLLPNSRAGAWIVVLALVGVSAWLARADREHLRAFLHGRRRLVIGYEVLFAVALAAWAVYRAYTPNIEPAGGEKFMEMAFINSTLTSPRFPPTDPWLSGYAISYYYFGYVQAALLVHLSALAPSVAFNLVIPGTFAMTCLGAFGLGADMVGLDARASRRAAMLAGGLAASLTAVLGSLIGAVELGFLRGLGGEGPYRWLAIRDLTPGGVCDTDGDGYGVGGLVPSRFIWWWRGSRVIYDLVNGHCAEIIHEFPQFSFMLGDVHPHVLALPFVLAVLALALAVLAGALDEELATRPGRRTVFAALLVGGLGFLNTWDLPTFGSVVVVALLLRAWALPVPDLRLGRGDRAIGALAVAASAAAAWWIVPGLLEALRGIPPASQPVVARASFALALGLAVAAIGYTAWTAVTRGARPDAVRVAAGVRAALWLTLLAVGLYLPFYVGFRSQADGFGVTQLHSRLGQWLVHFGLLAYLAATVVVAWLPHGLRRRVCMPAIVAVAMLLPVAGVALARGGWTPVVGSLMAAAAAFAALQLWFHGERRGADPGPADRGPGAVERPSTAPEAAGALSFGVVVPAAFALSCIALGAALALVPEFVFVRDLFNSRMNTVFKLFFQAWVLLAVGGSYAVHSVWMRGRRAVGVAWSVPVLLLIGAGALYPIQAAYTRTDGFALRAVTLDGLAHWATVYPADLGAVEWLRSAGAPGAVLVEAYGGAYEHNGRISMASGVPAVLGWEGHEHQWRGTREQIDPRKADIEAIYTTSDDELRRRLLERYDVRYVVLGDTERGKFGLTADHEERLRNGLEVAYESPDGRLQVLERR